MISRCWFCWLCEIVGNEGNEEEEMKAMKEEMKQYVKQELKKKWQWSNGAISDEDNEGSESSVHDGDTVASDDDSGSLETRNKKQETKKQT